MWGALLLTFILAPPAGPCIAIYVQVRFVLKDDIQRQLDSRNIVLLSNIGECVEGWCVGGALEGRIR